MPKGTYSPVWEYFQKKMRRINGYFAFLAIKRTQANRSLYLISYYILYYLIIYYILILYKFRDKTAPEFSIIRIRIRIRVLHPSLNGSGSGS